MHEMSEIAQLPIQNPHIFNFWSCKTETKLYHLKSCTIILYFTKFLNNYYETFFPHSGTSVIGPLIASLKCGKSVMYEGKEVLYTDALSDMKYNVLSCIYKLFRVTYSSLFSLDPAGAGLHSCRPGTNLYYHRVSVWGLHRGGLLQSADEKVIISHIYFENSVMLISLCEIKVFKYCL